VDNLVRLLTNPRLGPVAVVTSDGAGVVLRDSLPADADAVAAMHERCSQRTLSTRYQAGTRTIPRRLLHRPLAAPRGRTVVGVVGHEVIAVGQLANTRHPEIGEVWLIVEDQWQRQGVGAALLRYLTRTARAAGHTELLGWAVADDDSLVRTARRAGIPVSTRYQDGLRRVTIDPTRPADTEPAQPLPAGSSSPRS
jgi:GNAT superfamily N-acetyltransferase